MARLDGRASGIRVVCRSVALSKPSPPPSQFGSASGLGSRCSWAGLAMPRSVRKFTADAPVNLPNFTVAQYASTTQALCFLGKRCGRAPHKEDTITERDSTDLPQSRRRRGWFLLALPVALAGVLGARAWALGGPGMGAMAFGLGAVDAGGSPA
jgi:hypothetical protein